jgi:glycosyltransferase involved in cell wall biosynthesis
MLRRSLSMIDARKPTILLVGPLPPPAGGIATAVLDLLKSDLAEDFKIVHVDNSTKRPVSKKGKIDILNTAAFIFQVFLLIVKIMRHRPKLVQIETSSGISFVKNSLFALISKVALRKVIISLHGSGSGFTEFFHSLPPIGKLYLKFVLSRCDIVRILSAKWVAAFISEFGLEESKICVIPNAVRIEDFDNGISFKDQTGNEVTLLFLGWVGAKKGVFDLLDSSEILASKGYQFKLLIVGPEMKEGDADKVREAVAEKHLEKRVQVLGEKERSEALKYYNIVDIYLLPSYSEGLPLSILEAMAAGLPIVSTKVGAISDVIEEGENGFLITPGDVVELTSRIELLMVNASLRRTMGVKNKAKVRDKYCLPSHLEMFRKLYLRLL